MDDQLHATMGVSESNDPVHPGNEAGNDTSRSDIAFERHVSYVLLQIIYLLHCI